MYYPLKVYHKTTNIGYCYATIFPVSIQDTMLIGTVILFALVKAFSNVLS